MSEVLITKLVVRSDQIDRARRVFSDMQADVHANEPRTTFYQFYQQADKPTVFWVHEVFADQAAKTFHLGRHGQRGQDFKEILAEPPVFTPAREI